MLHKGKPRIFDDLNLGKLSKYPSITTPSQTFTKENKLLHSKSTYFYRWEKLPAVCVLALLAGVGISLLNCNNEVYADSLSLSFTANPDDAGATNVTNRDEVQYREYGFNVNYSDLKGDTFYYVSVSTEDVHDGQLFNEDFPTFRINGVSENTKPIDSFNDNTWGYNLTKESTAKEELEYSIVPTANSNPKAATYRTNKNENNSGSDSFRLNFAAKFGDDAPAGNYRTSVYLSVIMDPSKAPFDGIKTMQEMTNNACKDTYEGVSEQLEDIRINADGKTRKYWVTKLKDDNCWMTQNLDYDIKVGDFVGAQPTKTGNVNTGWIGYDDLSIIQSWNPEDLKKYYYRYEPITETTGWNNCGTGLANMLPCVDTAGNYLSETAPKEGEHYRVGNFYSWNAATAGTGGSMISGNA